MIPNVFFFNNLIFLILSKESSFSFLGQIFRARKCDVWKVKVIFSREENRTLICIYRSFKFGHHYGFLCNNAT